MPVRNRRCGVALREGGCNSSGACFADLYLPIREGVGTYLESWFSRLFVDYNVLRCIVHRP